jgi:hypothetical protein
VSADCGLCSAAGAGTWLRSRGVSQDSCIYWALEERNVDCEARTRQKGWQIRANDDGGSGIKRDDIMDAITIPIKGPSEFLVDSFSGLWGLLAGVGWSWCPLPASSMANAGAKPHTATAAESRCPSHGRWSLQCLFQDCRHCQNLTRTLCSGFQWKPPCHSRQREHCTNLIGRLKRHLIAPPPSPLSKASRIKTLALHPDRMARSWGACAHLCWGPFPTLSLILLSSFAAFSAPRQSPSHRDI